MKKKILLTFLLVIGMLCQVVTPAGRGVTINAEVAVEEVQDAKQGDKVVFKGDRFQVVYEIAAKWNTGYFANSLVIKYPLFEARKFTIYESRIAAKEFSNYLIDEMEKERK